MGILKSPNLLFQSLSRQAQADEKAVLETRAQLLELWAMDPWEWLTGQDLDGHPLIWTRDEGDDKAPLRPFPRELAYLKRISEAAFGSEPLYIEKPRQMYVSTLLMLLMDWYCRFVPARNCLVSKQKESLAERLMAEKVRSPHRRLPEWVQDALPISPMPANCIKYLKTESFIYGVAQNFADGDARGMTASIVFVDEVGYQDNAPEIVSAVGPMVSRLWNVTTPNISRGGTFFTSIVEEQ